MSLTRTEQAYMRLRADILSGRLAPDTALRLDALREAYGFSFSPLREAMVRLQAERLVVLYEQRGFRVAPVRLEEMWDLIEGRILLETAALRDSIAHQTPEGEAAIRASLEAMRIDVAHFAAAPAAEHEAILEALRSYHRNFHLLLLAECRSARLRDLAGQLMVEADRYRAPAFAQAVAAGQGPGALWAGQAGRDAMQEHGALAEAVLARDADRACDLLAAHYRRTGAAMAAQVADAAE